MRKLCIFLAMLSLCACKETIDRPIDVLPSVDNEIDQLLSEQQGDVDIANLEALLCSNALEMNYYLKDGKEQKEQNKRFIFNEDGTCRILLHRTISKVVDEDKSGNHIWNDVEEYYYSRVYKWSLDKDSKTLTTEDDYGNTFSATIIYGSDVAIVYDGCIGDELRTIESGCNYRTLAKFVADREAWTDVAVSYDVVFRSFACENDSRLQKMLNLIDSANNSVDDDKFVDALLTKVVAMENDVNGTESGCAYYGDVSMYVYDNGAYLYHDVVEGGVLPSILVMLENGIYRECFTSDILDLSGPNNAPKDSKLYLEYNWSYDKQTNTLYTHYSDKNGAEVLYVSENEAILRGHICGYPCTGEYGIFYIVFNKYDRESILKEYNTNYLDLI